MQTFNEGDRVVVESPIFITSTGVQDHSAHASPIPGEPRPAVGDTVVVESVMDYAASGEHVATEDGWVIAVEGLIAEGDVDLLAAQRAPLANGDRVAIMSTVYAAGTVWEHSSDGTAVEVGDTGTVHEAKADTFGDIYVRMDATEEVLPFQREGVAPLEADVIEGVFPEDLHEDEVEAILEQDAADEAKFSPFIDEAHVFQRATLNDWRTQFAAYAYPQRFIVGTTATDRERALRVATDAWAAFANATDGGEGAETVEPYDDAEAIVILARFLTEG